MLKTDDTIYRVQCVDPSGAVRTVKRKGVKKKLRSKYPLQYTDFGFFILIPILSGLGAGIFFDRLLGTAPYCTIGLIVGGGILAIYNLFAILNKDGSNRSSRSTQG